MDSYRYDATPQTRIDGTSTQAQVGSKGQVFTQRVDANGASQGTVGNPDYGAVPGLYATSGSITRPSDTTQYTANDVVGVTGGGTAAITFALGAVSGSSIMIRSLWLMRNASAVIANETTYLLYLYSVTPPSGLADNAVFDLASGDRASFLGKIAISQIVDEGSTLYIEMNGINKMVKLAGTSLFAYLVTVGNYVPASAAVHSLGLYAEQM